VFAVAAALGLQACTGLYLSVPDEGREDQPEIKVTPITPQLLAQTVPGRAMLPPTLPGAVPASYVYRAGVGDVIDVSVPSIASAPYAGAAPAYPVPREADRGYTVAPDGTIYLPYAGSLKVQGSTIREIQDQVVRELSRFIKSPQVTVSVAQFRSQKVLIAGQIPKPGYLPVTDVPLTLIGALAAVGSTVQLRSDLVARPVSAQVQGPQPESGDYRHVQLSRAGRVEIIDLVALLRSGDPARDPLLQDGDVIYVAPVDRNYVYVLGEVRQPALLEIVEHRTSLAEVLMASGGLNQGTSNAERIYVIRGRLDHPEVFQLDADAADALLLADAFLLDPRDVIYVAEANISRWNRFLSQLVPTLQSLITGGIFANTVGR
jgi:polysaccharide export outer membrane protein